MSYFVTLSAFSGIQVSVKAMMSSLRERIVSSIIEDLLDGRNQSPSQFTRSLTSGYNNFGGIFNNGWSFFNRRDFMLDGED